LKIWTVCDKGHVHWGSDGGAGLLLRAPHQGDTVYLLEQRSRRMDFGGTWDIPGGAMREGESPELAARREAEEEVGSIPAYRVVGVDAQDCGGGWKFYVVTADVDRPFTAFSVQETDATGWFTRDEMNSLSLHPDLRKWLDQRGFWSSQPVD
jgi:8-oxo-dGTP diphosphatase